VGELIRGLVQGGRWYLNSGNERKGDGKATLLLTLRLKKIRED